MLPTTPTDLAGAFFKIRPDPVPDDDLLPDGVLTGKELFGQGFVDEGDQRRAGGVLVSELAAADHGNPEQLVVVGRGAHPPGSGRSLGGSTGCPTMVKGKPELALDGQAAGKGRVLDPGNGIQALPSVMGELGHAGGLFEAGAGQRHLHGDHVVRVKAGVHRVQGDEGADEQGRADQQDHRQSTSLTTSAARTRPWRMPVPARLLESLSVEFRSVREMLKAGNSPKRMPVTQETVRVNASTRQSTPMADPSSPMRGSPAGLMASSARTPESRESGPECHRR